MKVYLGPAGVPIGCKEKSTVEGIKFVANIGLNFMEIQFVRGVRMKKTQAMEVRKTAKDVDVKLSAHAPYFVNLSSEKKDVIEKSKQRIVQTLEIAKILDAWPIVVHAGYYYKNNKAKSFEMVKKALLEILETHSYRPKDIGIETMGKQSQFGTLDEVLRLHEEVGITPVIDFAHIHARCGGCLRNKDDFSNIFKRLLDLGIKRIHTHFTCVEYKNKNEKKHLTLDAKDPNFLLLAEALVNFREDIDFITIVSESPILEKDALKMKKILDDEFHRC